MSDIDQGTKRSPPRFAPPHAQGLGAGAVAAGAYGAAPFFGPWKHNHAWAQAAQKKPLVIGLTMDASGQYGASGGMRAPRRDDGDQGVQRQGRRARPHDRGDPHGHGDDAGHRLARRRAHDHAQRSRVPDRRAAFGRRQRDLAGRAEIRLRLPQHQLELADRGGQELPPRQVRLGRQRHQLRAGDRQERDEGQRQELGAADQRLRVGPQTSKATRTLVEANGGKIVDELLVPQNTRDFSSYLIKIQQIKPNVVAAAIGGDDIKALRQQVVQLEARTRAWRGSTTSRTGPTSTGSAPRRSSACSAPTGTTGSICRASRSSSPKYQKTYPGHGDPRAGQRLLQRLHGHARAPALPSRTPGTTNNIAVIKKLEGLQDVSARDRHAGLRRLDGPGDAPVPADDLHGDLQRQAGREGRHLQDPRQVPIRRTSRTTMRRRPASSRPTRRRRATSCRGGRADARGRGAHRRRAYGSGDGRC